MMGVNEPKLVLAPGEPVVVLRETRNMYGTGTITATTIDRAMKRDVVLANGLRFNRDRLQRRNGDWDPPTLLLHPDDSRVVRMRKANAVQRRCLNLENACQQANRLLRQRQPDEACSVLKAALEADGTS